MWHPRISVILDNYNYARFLRKAIDSVLEQSYDNYELIVVDDGSSDESRSIIDSYAMKHPSIIKVYKENGGQMSAFNEAFCHLGGDIIAFLDSDDYWYPGKLERIAEKHRRHRLVQHYLSNNGKGIYREVRTDIDWHSVLMDYGYLYNHSVCSSLSFDRRMLEPFFPFFNEHLMKYCADGILLMIALSLEQVGFIEEVLGFYRIHESNGFAGKHDRGDEARRILAAQHRYANEQLGSRGYPRIPFSRHRYFAHLVDGFMRDGLLSKTDRLLLYGTESSGLYLSEVLEARGFSVEGYLDSSNAKQGKSFRGKKIYSPDTIHDLPFDHILIASSAQKAISKVLAGYGLVDGKEYYTLPI